MPIKAPLALNTLASVLRRDVADGMVSPTQAREVRRQERLFQVRRRAILRQFRGQIVAYAGGKRYVGTSIADVIEKISAVNPALVFYAEEIPR